MCQLRKGGRRGDIIQNKPPGSGACFELDRVSSGVGRHSAGNSNDLSGVSAHGKIQESLGSLGELGALLGCLLYTSISAMPEMEVRGVLSS